MRPTAQLALSLAALLGAASCFPPDEEDPAGTPVRPTSPPATIEGRYQVVSRFDVTVLAAAPGPAHDALGLLAGLRRDPAGTLVAALDRAGVPLVADLLDALPSVLRGPLLGWINDHLAAALFADERVSDRLDRIAALAELVLARFDLLSEMTPGAAGATLTHRAAALRFPLPDHALVVPIPEAPRPLVTSTVAAARSEPGAGGTDGRLVIGDHAFGLAYGELAYAALEESVRLGYGTDLRGALGRLFDCPSLAAEIAGRCTLGVCVGHAAELEAICEAGLDEAVAQVRERFEALRFDAVRLRSGGADLHDDDGDGRADRMSDGTWQAEIDFSQGPRPVPARFSGAR